jgi:diaminopimelate decarboxylase
MTRTSSNRQRPAIDELLKPLTVRAPHPARRPPTVTHIGAHSVEDLVARFGSPLCVFDEDRLRSSYRSLLSAFREHWEKTRIAWSVKTNWLSAIAATLRSEGALGEVVSGFEYGICRDLGIPGTDIIFNGPWKSDEELLRAFSESAWVNIDGADELERILELAKGLKTPCKVGLRINVKLNYPPWDKFGFRVDEQATLDAARAISRHKKLILAGLHLHVGTYVPDVNIYRQGMESMVALALKLEAELGCTIESLDIGGGYATRNTLRGVMLPGSATAPSYADYAQAVTAPLRTHAKRFRSKPTLTLEPGRGLVDECAKFIGTVLAVKRPQDSQQTAILDVGVHILPTAYWYEHEVSPTRDDGKALAHWRLAGNLCMQIDVIREEVILPELSRGDRLIIHDVGAYNFSQSMQFIQLRPNYVMLRGKEAHLIRRAETAMDARGAECLPKHLVTQESQASALIRPPL